jgi:hypothetical protein
MSDENMHATREGDAWSESYYFNFVDPASKLGMFTRMGFRPGSGWADALHVVYLEGKRVAFTYGRRDIKPDLTQYDGDLSAGALALTCKAPFERWHIDYDGPAQDIPDAGILLERSKSRPDGWFTPATLRMNLIFDCLTKPHYAAQGERGHFEQSGHVTGTVELGNDHWQVDGYGVRDKSWGPRDWGAGNRQGSSGTTPVKIEGPAPFVNWFSMNFGAHAALGGSCFRHADGVMRGEGWMQRDRKSMAIRNVVITTEYNTHSIIHERVTLTGESEDGEHIDIEGKVLSVCPTKIPMPGGATFVNEGLAEFHWGERIGYGIAEHWHAVSLS